MLDEFVSFACFIWLFEICMKFVFFAGLSQFLYLVSLKEATKQFREVGGFRSYSPVVFQFDLKCCSG